MNSNQRRQEKRKYPSKLDLPRGYYYNPDVNETVKNWLRSNTVGNFKTCSYDFTIRFSKEQDAIMFALTFSAGHNIDSMRWVIYES